jgi:hypothetical protein
MAACSPHNPSTYADTHDDMTTEERHRVVVVQWFVPAFLASLAGVGPVLTKQFDHPRLKDNYAIRTGASVSKCEVYAHYLAMCRQQGILHHHCTSVVASLVTTQPQFYSTKQLLPCILRYLLRCGRGYVPDVQHIHGEGPSPCLPRYQEQQKGAPRPGQVRPLSFLLSCSSSSFLVGGVGSFLFLLSYPCSFFANLD